ncbi:MAG: M12 family metallo-peptidase [Planctomycetota bacterium]
MASQRVARSSGWILSGLCILFAVTAPRVEAQSLLERAQNDMLLSDAEIVALTLPDGISDSFAIQFVAFGETIELVVWPHSVRDPEFAVEEQLPNGAFRGVEPAPLRTVRGESLSPKGLKVTGSLDAGTLIAMIDFPDGRTLWVEPLATRYKDTDVAKHIVYWRDDILPADGVCGTTATTTTGPMGGGSVPLGGSTCGSDVCVAQIACDADNEYYDYYGTTSSVQTRIEMVINIVNSVYERDCNLTHQITTILVRTSEPDPYSSTNPDVLLVQLANQWNTSHGSISRDVVHMFSGKNLDGSVIGIADIAEVCDISDAYGLSTNYVLNIAFMTDLTAHELGHSWGGTHCACSSPAYTMNSTITASNRHYQVETVPEIEAYRDSVSCLAPSQMNDFCENAWEICPGSYGWNTTNATSDISPSCATANLSVWFLYRPGATGSCTINTDGSALDTVLSVRNGCGGASTEVACNDDGGIGLASSVTFTATEGDIYLIRIAGFMSAVGQFNLNVAGPSCEPPVNNFCGNAIEIGPGDYRGATQGATDDGTASCGSSSSTADVWFLYRPRISEIATVDTCDSTYDTVLTLYTGGCGTAGTQIFCNDDAPFDCGASGDLQSRIEWTTTAGETYWIRVSGFSGAVGAFRLGLTGPQSISDECAENEPLPMGTTYHSLSGASPEGDSACGGDTSGNADVWYRFTAPAVGELIVQTCGTHDWRGADTGMDTVVSFHASCAAASFACNDDSATCDFDQGNNRDSRVAADLDVGDIVYVRISHFSGSDPAPFVLIADFVPVNETCVTAVAINPGTYLGSLFDATNDGSATCITFPSGSSPDVWYRYTAPVAGNAYINTCGTHDLGLGVDFGMNTVLSLFTGSCSGLLAQIECNNTWTTGDDPSACVGDDAGTAADAAVVTHMNAGQMVLIRVAKFTSLFSLSENGPFVLNLAFIPDFLPPGDAFKRADFNGNNSVDIADAVGLLNYLFVPASPIPACRDAADVNNDGSLAISDAIFLLGYLFLPGSPVPPAPFGACGLDTGAADLLDCVSYPPCP